MDTSKVTVHHTAFSKLIVKLVNIPDSAPMIKMTNRWSKPDTMELDKNIFFSHESWRALFEAIPSIKNLNPAFKAKNKI